MDDLREAGRIRAALSTSLMSSAGTAFAAGIALVAFASGQFQVDSWSWGSWAGAALAFLLSAVAGGLAIRDLTDRGSKGDWRLTGSSKCYHGQVLLLMLGALLLSVGFIRVFSPPQRQPQATGQQLRIELLKLELDQTRVQEEALARRLRSAERK